MKLATLTFLLLLVQGTLCGQYDENRSIVFTSLESALHENPARVYYLDLKQKELSHFPEEILAFENLIHLNLAHNTIKSLDGIDLSSLKDLESIILYDNKLRVFPYAALSTAPNLREIDLGENDLKSIDALINRFRFLEDLDVSGNRIATTAENIKLPFLKKLNIERNYLHEFPAFLKASPRLEVLNLYGNQIDNIPGDLQQLSKLNYLNLGDNPIKKVNENIKLRKLKTLILDWVDLSSSTLFSELIQQATFLEILSMEHCHLQNIPQEVLNLRRLREISFLNNELRHVDPSIFKNKKLNKIWLGGNRISEQKIVELKRITNRTNIIH